MNFLKLKICSRRLFCCFLNQDPCFSVCVFSVFSDKTGTQLPDGPKILEFFRFIFHFWRFVLDKKLDFGKIGENGLAQKWQFILLRLIPVRRTFPFAVRSRLPYVPVCRTFPFAHHSIPKRYPMAQCWQKFVSLLQDSRKILISSHARGDGDALGSELALAAALRSLGYTVTVVNPDPPAETFRFLGKDFDAIRFFDGTRDQASAPDPRKMSRSEAQTYDTLLIVDTSSRSQLRSISELADSGHFKVLVLDHHAFADRLTPHTFSDPSQPAAGCLVMELLESLHVPLTLREEGASCSIADFLFFAIATDTGWFRFPSVRPDTLRQAALLMESGASTARHYRFACENYAPGRMRLLEALSRNFTLECGGRLAYSKLEKKDFNRANAQMSDTAEMVNLLLTTSGVDVACLFTKVENGVRLNFRSRENYDVAQVAGQFGGGGHKNASGAFLGTSMTEAQKRVLPALCALFHDLTHKN